MERLQFSIRIQAPREQVWHTMLDDATYREWTQVFHAGSHFVGGWEQGSTIRFLAPEDDGSTSGMISMVEEVRPPEFVSLRMLGEVVNGVDDTTSDRVKSWAGGREQYTFREDNGSTEVVVEVDTTAEFKDYFLQAWPKALERLKVIAER